MGSKNTNEVKPIQKPKETNINRKETTKIEGK